MQASALSANEPALQCRLCLQGIAEDDGAERLQDIFTEDDSLLIKIRNCLGVFISPRDIIRTICSNCRQTVCLIDEFRTLCRQTEEIFEAVRIPCDDSQRWERYAECVGELRKLVQGHKDVINQQLVGGRFEVVKVEPIDEDSVTKLWVEPDYVDSEEEVHEKKLPISLKISLAQEIRNNPEVWDSSLAGSAQATDQIWKNIAGKFEMDVATIRHHWRMLQEVNRAHRKGDEEDTVVRTTGDADLNKLIGILQFVGEQGAHEHEGRVIQKAKEDNNLPEMLDAHEVDEEDEDKTKRIVLPFNSQTKKMALAKRVYKHENLWNRKHQNFHNRKLRNSTWDQVAASFNVTRTDVKYAWRRLRDLYRTKQTRLLLRKKSHPDAQVCHDPFFKQLQLMLAEHTRFGTRAKSSALVTESGSVVAASLTADDEDQSSERAKGDLVQVKIRKRQEATVAYKSYKRRYERNRKLDDSGCIKVVQEGIARYMKICELCGKQVERAQFEYHMNQHNGLKPYVCSFEGCARQYGNKISRNRHEVLAHFDEAYKFECDQCGEKFKLKCKHDIHYAVKHKSQNVPCRVCGKLLKHKSLLQEHMRRVHTGKMQQVCKVCGKVLQKKYSLDVHMRTHTNEKPYRCEICGQCYVQKVQLKSHLSRTHQLSWEQFQAIHGSTSQ